MSELYTLKQSTKYPDLYVRKYKRKVFYDNLWHKDPLLVESRGHVFTESGKLVINPPTKVFNRNENGTDINLDEECLVVDKINGFMACLTWVPEVNDVVVSTTGSLDSPYVGMAREMLSYAIAKLKEFYAIAPRTPATLVFEICHPNDPHIIKENYGAYLLATRSITDTQPYSCSLENQEEMDILASVLRVSRPFYDVTTFKQVTQNIKTCKHEGYMVYGLTSGTVLKLKSTYYLALKAIARKKDILSLNKNVLTKNSIHY